MERGGRQLSGEILQGAAKASAILYPVATEAGGWPGSGALRDRFATQDDREALRYLLDATSALLEESLSTERLLQTAAHLAVPRLADCCRVDLVEGDQLMQVARVGGSSDGDMVSSSSGLDSPSLLQMLRARGPVLCCSEEVTPSQGTLIVPLQAQDRLLGAMTLIRLGRGHAPQEIAVTRELARRIAIALGTASRYEEERAALRAHDELLAVVAHELRNPLNAILTTTSRALEIETLAPLRSPVERCQRAGRKMARIINNLMDAASLAEGMLALCCQEDDIAPVLTEALDLLQPLAEARRLALRIELSGAPLRVYCDRDRVVQVLSNLVGNAIKFATSETTIHISAEPDGAMVRLAVRDRGPGIAPVHLPRLFDRFWRLDQGTQKGTGLGLYIAKGIVERHGGRLWVESMAGEGSTFYFTLPTSPEKRTLGG